MGQPLADDIDEDVFKIAKAGYWTVEHLTAAKAKLLGMGALATPAGTARSLNPSELLVVQRTAVMDPVSAVCQYLAFASGVDPQSMTPQQLDEYATRLLYDAKWRPVADDAALFAFANCPTTGYKQTPEHDAYIREYAGSRPLSFPLLAAAWRECQQAERRGEMQRRAARPITLEQIDTLPDEQVSSLYTGSLRERARRLNQAAHGQEQPQNAEQALLRAREEFERRGYQSGRNARRLLPYGVKL